jgi:TonB family protein
MASGTPTDERAFAAGLMALVREARHAVQQWLYESPADAPIAFDVVIGFTPEGDAQVIAQGTGRSQMLATTHSMPNVGSSGILRSPTKIKHVNPVYPAAARDAKISGVVILEARIEVDGRIREAQVVRSIPELDGAALDAVKQWEFVPQLVDGMPTPVTMTMTIQFSLN